MCAVGALNVNTGVLLLHYNTDLQTADDGALALIAYRLLRLQLTHRQI